MTDLPEPLVAGEVDLRDFPFMPLDVQRLLTSETWLTGTGDEKAAALTLWLVSWHQVPAGSLPDNDRMLEVLSQAGSRWKKVKAAALRGFVKCSDGRLYHRVVAEKAAEAWERKKAQRERTAKAREARQRQREQNVSNRPDKDATTETVTFSVTENVTASKGQGQRQGQLKENKRAAADAAPDLSDLETQLYDRGKQILGPTCGGMVKRLLLAKGGSIAKARAALEEASEKANPREYVGAMIANRPAPPDRPRTSVAI